MQYRTIGILAHVDAGKTTLSERLLVEGGSLRAPSGAYLDSDAQEQARGITIFASQAEFQHGGFTYQLVDTPGHIDFAAEMERTLAILDAAVVVVSAPDGVQGHTETIWQRLGALGVPTFLFLNKCDRAAPGPALAEVRSLLSEDCIDLSGGLGPAAEALAERDERLLEVYLEHGYNQAAFIAAAREMVRQRRLFPTFCGSAREGVGVEALLDGLDALLVPHYDPAAPFAAQCYGVRRQPDGTRLALLKITAGTLRPRGHVGAGKVGELRLLRGAKSENLPLAEAGRLCAASGLPEVRIGDGLGAAPPLPGGALKPLLSAKVLFSCPPQQAVSAFKTLEDEDPALAAEWGSQLSQLTVRIMGQVQLEVLTEVLRTRFGMEVSFAPPEVLYLETIAAPVEGWGHFEPLRHYAEVGLRLEPAPRGSGISFASECPTDVLALNWQRLIETHVFERIHRGVLTGSPLTDVRAVLLCGRAHEKHTEGGDFRESVYRAIRHALMHAENVLLEPCVQLSALVEPANAGRLLSDLSRMSAETAPPVPQGARTRVQAVVPLSETLGYAQEFAAYTHGRGMLSLLPAGYRPCHDTAAAVARRAYDPERDVEHTADSVFCSHGAGRIIPWREAAAHMHCRR